MTDDKAAHDRLLAKARRLIGLNDEIWAEMTTSCAGTVRLGVLIHLLVFLWSFSFIVDFVRDSGVYNSRPSSIAGCLSAPAYPSEQCLILKGASL